MTPIANVSENALFDRWVSLGGRVRQKSCSMPENGMKYDDYRRKCTSYGENKGQESGR
ncbi:hypothetical protein AA0242T_1396 [Acetobacter aceti NRIC 0242]|uniref:Uncharacterized protein n=2 Tax=Acetobacter aceti TaxID=435 RepID=A0A6S6PI14_ACEAC|nr:hypothetical protein AAJCM20276_08750 [Acetobacter aceti]BCK77226.1 hypothetical protein EMQ_2832 [Acetobacter aceti NBRC 14818]GAN58296.1 hypothetical protein Abac_041_042 [Acetobacter aceti NBRC 14818]GBO80694.1 hypothetical protein AA0242T_1396 [Acetobacter aceti NRIC 0242]